MKLLLVLIPILVLCIIMFCTCGKQKEEFNNVVKKGIVFFDIDNTLSDMDLTQKEDIIQYCIDKGYHIGIVTASMRGPQHLVKPDGTVNYEHSPWMSENLANYLKKTNFKTFNSLIYTNGNENVESPSFDRNEKMYGWRKGWQMCKQINEGGYDLNNSFLFDDQVVVLKGATEMCKNITPVLVNNTKVGLHLNMKRLKTLF